jgi:heat shock protein HslJ
MLVSILGALALAACAGTQSDTSAITTTTTTGAESDAPAALAGTSWRLELLAGAPPVAGSAPTLVFGMDNRIAGTTGCNRYFGAYMASAGAIGDLGSTRMACAPPLMEQEQTFLGVVGGARSVVVGSDGLLIITGVDGRRAVFAPASTGS